MKEQKKGRLIKDLEKEKITTEKLKGGYNPKHIVEPHNWESSDTMIDAAKNHIVNKQPKQKMRKTKDQPE